MNIEGNENIDKRKAISDYLAKHPDILESMKNEIANFSWEEKFKYGILTITDLTNMIEINLNRAIELELKLSWAIKDKKIYGKILSENEVIFEKVYELKHTHLSLAKMQFDFDSELSAWEIFIKK